jgi:hypothetical protein
VHKCGRHDVTVEWAEVATIVSALAAFTGIQAFWISHALGHVYARLDRMDARLDGIESRLESIEVVLRDHGERIARLEVLFRGRSA